MARSWRACGARMLGGEARRLSSAMRAGEAVAVEGAGRASSRQDGASAVGRVVHPGRRDDVECDQWVRRVKPQMAHVATPVVGIDLEEAGAAVGAAEEARAAVGGRGAATHAAHGTGTTGKGRGGGTGHHGCCYSCAFWRAGNGVMGHRLRVRFSLYGLIRTGAVLVIGPGGEPGASAECSTGPSRRTCNAVNYIAQMFNRQWGSARCDRWRPGSVPDDASARPSVAR